MPATYFFGCSVAVLSYQWAACCSFSSNGWQVGPTTESSQTGFLDWPVDRGWGKIHESRAGKVVRAYAGLAGQSFWLASAEVSARRRRI